MAIYRDQDDFGIQVADKSIKTHLKYKYYSKTTTKEAKLSTAMNLYKTKNIIIITAIFPFCEIYTDPIFRPLSFGIEATTINLLLQYYSWKRKNLKILFTSCNLYTT